MGAPETGAERDPYGLAMRLEVTWDGRPTVVYPCRAGGTVHLGPQGAPMPAWAGQRLEGRRVQLHEPDGPDLVSVVVYGDELPGLVLRRADP